MAQIPIRYLDHFPGNVRQDLHLTREYLASLKEELQVALTVIPIPSGHERGPDENPDALFWVVKGNRRFGGARKIELDSLLCLIDFTKADKQALLYIDQVVENDEDFRRPLTVFEKNRALTLAFDAGATRTEIRKRTGRSRKEIADALAAGKLSDDTRAVAQSMDYAWTTEELAMLAEFEGDAAALARIERMVRQWGHDASYAIEVVRREREEAAAQAKAHAEALAALEEAGIPVTDDEPDGAVLLTVLARQIDDFDPDKHGDCPGRGAFFYSWRQETPEFYCSTPDRHGYTPPEPRPVTVEPAPAPAKPKDDGPSRRIVVEGNRAWMAAAAVRHKWLTAFFARKTAPKPVQRFVTRMLNDMPAALRDELGRVKYTTLYSKLGGPAELDTALAVASPGRLAMLQLLPIAAAFEYQMSEASAECKNTWREGRYSPCSTSDAALWLRFLVQELGPELADKAYVPVPIEQALIEGVPYRGDNPAERDRPDGVVAEPQEEPESSAEEVDAEIGESEGEVLPGNAGVGDSDGVADGVAVIGEVLDEPEQEASLPEPFQPGAEDLSGSDMEVSDAPEGTDDTAGSGIDPIAA
ncbi:hypothetical protein C1J01_10820 [Nonomuraea aridisoli]|uniref:ParB/Sulfiredoxin domain-containing protein n=1 Tax=Nonomuraea aridisoli TaxID=2070368 RepID=A0A2W2EU28_9ACTN|nr:hypothetical protein C1J01_10820 [Nonomuraea aridisoli]